MPDAVALAQVVVELDAADSPDAALERLAAGVRTLTGAAGVAVLTRADGAWSAGHVCGSSRLGEHGQVGPSPGCDAVAVAGVPGPAADVADAVLVPVLGLGTTVALLAVSPADALQPGAGPVTDALVDVATRHAGVHVIRMHDAAVRKDLLAQRATAVGTLARMADTDRLTGVANRAGLFRVLGSLAGRGQPTGLVLIDLDEFKVVNDTRGHAVGDELLRQVAARLTRLVRPTDVVGRLGGDEFVLVVRDADGPMLSGLVARLERAFAEPFEVGGTPVAVQASCGVAMSADAPSVADLLQLADRAMYERKRTKRRRAGADRATVIDLHRSAGGPA